MANAKIALLSHRIGNIGHLFMSVGFEEIVNEMFDGKVDINHIEQHKFFSIYPTGHWLHWLDKIPHGRIKTLRRWLNSPAMCEKFWPAAPHLQNYSGAITCGGPSIVRGVGSTPEMCLMFHHQLGAFHHHGVPTFDCGVGSGGFALKSLPSTPAEAFDDADKAYFKRLFSYSTVSTVRDTYAQQLWQALGRNAPLIPCGALVSGRKFERLAKRPPLADRHIVINYQMSGANSAWGQPVDIDRWRVVVAELVTRLQKRHKVVFLCHNQAEARHAQQVRVNIPRLQPTTLDEYASIIMHGKAGLASRIHAAIPMAGVGLPVIAIGTDTRLGTLELMGLKAHYVDEVTPDQLEHEIEQGIQSEAEEQERLLALREETSRKYIEIFSQHIKC